MKFGLVFAIVAAMVLPSCSDPAQQAKFDAGVTHAVTIACNVDGIAVPIAQPIVGAIGPVGATAAGIDAALVHPAVVAYCKSRNGVPVAEVAPVPAAVPVASAPAVPAPAAGASPAPAVVKP